MTTLVGYASLVNTPYSMFDALGSYTETIRAGAFVKSLAASPDVVLVANHGGLPLSRTTSGTMKLSEDATGLRVHADLDDEDPDVRALLPKMRRGDLTEMSFMFRALDQAWSEDYSERTILEADLHRGDVSVVTYGASPTTWAKVSDGLADPPPSATVGRARSANRLAGGTRLGRATLTERRRMAERVGDTVRIECRGWRIENRRPGSGGIPPLIGRAARARGIIIPDAVSDAKAKLALARARGRR